MTAKQFIFGEDPHWYRDAVIYQLHIKTFYDSNGDGIGDFRGLMEKLDYLEDLGVTAIWLLPFYPSPLRDDGYDIADYYNINPDYGTLRDFRLFLAEAHRRGLRVITELVLNHTSDQHPWFQRSRRARPGSVWRDFYVWSDTQDRYKDARIIFLDFEPSNWAWDPVARAYYWHRFYSHQPDLNFDNPHVHKAMFRVIDFWLGMGVDGVRLDAVPYLYEREGTNCENLPETHRFLKALRSHVEGKFRDKMLLAEANQWPEDAVAYFGDGDECQMAFHFPVMPRIFMAMQMEDRFPVIEILRQTPGIPDSCQWAMFLRNHDELTLEMVTDEERDYMYKVYARDPKARINLGIRRRLAPLVGNNRRQIELMNMLLFSLPGTPVLYYGDEIGMGDNYYLGDRNGVRTPMQWSADRNAGFSRANPQKLYLPVIIDPEYHYEALNVENQEGNASSLLWWMKRALGMRKKLKALGRGSLEFVASENPKILAFVRELEDETALVVINLSRFSQVVELDLSRHAGSLPREVFSQNAFPVIREEPYVLTLGSYDYFWFALRKEEAGRAADLASAAPELRVTGEWEKVLSGKFAEKLEEAILPRYIKKCRWFAGKGRMIQKVRITEQMPLRHDAFSTILVFLEVAYTEGIPETYILPLSWVSGEKAERIAERLPQALIAHVRSDSEDGIIYDGAFDDGLAGALFWMIEKRRTFRGIDGQAASEQGRLFRKLMEGKKAPFSAQMFKADQSNTSFQYENSFFFKLYRKIEEGVNPDTEIVRYLTEKTRFSRIPPFAGMIEYRRHGAAPCTIGQLQGFVESQGDAWTHTQNTLGSYFEGILSRGGDGGGEPPLPSSLFDIRFQMLPPMLQEHIGGFYLEMVGLLGTRTAEMHIALSAESEDQAFNPEPFSMLYQRSLYQSMRNLASRNLQMLRSNLKRLPEGVRKDAAEVLDLEPAILSGFQKIVERKFPAMKTRYHGDFHLGQVLFTGKDFIIIDFEGEPARSLSERRLKRSPLRDVAGMIRSFHYAVHSALRTQASLRPEDVRLLEAWGECWYHYVSGVFLSSYLDSLGTTGFVPKERGDLEIMLHCFLLEKAVYELGYELNNRPDWVGIPISGIKHLLVHMY